MKLVERHEYLIRLGMEAVASGTARYESSGIGPGPEALSLAGYIREEMSERMAQAAQVWAADLEDS